MLQAMLTNYFAKCYGNCKANTMELQRKIARFINEFQESDRTQKIMCFVINNDPLPNQSFKKGPIAKQRHLKLLFFWRLLGNSLLIPTDRAVVLIK